MERPIYIPVPFRHANIFSAYATVENKLGSVNSAVSYNIFTLAVPKSKLSRESVLLVILRFLTRLQTRDHKRGNAGLRGANHMVTGDTHSGGTHVQPSGNRRVRLT